MQTEIPIDVLFQDEVLLVVNKPAGLLVIPDGYDRRKSNLITELSRNFGRLWVVHRLDQDTSGVIVFARTAEAHRQLNAQFEQHSIPKVYHLLSYGQVDWVTYSNNLPLQVNGDRRHRTIIDVQRGKPAHTVFSLLDRFSDGFTLFSASPTTGYTHQIRAHAASLGLWLLNDPLYFPRPFPPPPGFHPLHRTELFSQVEHLPIRRTSLHAFEIAFIHPISNVLMRFQASYPVDFKETLRILRELL